MINNWTVDIPEPKSKRLNKIQLMVYFSFGFSGVGSIQVFDILTPGKFDFYISDDIEYLKNTSVLDGDVFWTEVEYTKDGSSRREKTEVIPKRLNQL